MKPETVPPGWEELGGGERVGVQVPPTAPPKLQEGGWGSGRDSSPLPGISASRPPPVLGSDPYIHVKGYDAGWIQLVCRSEGWFPKPLAQWRDPQGKALQLVWDADSQEAGLFRIAVSSRVRDSTVGNVSCSLRNVALGQEKTTAMVIAGKSPSSKWAESPW